jgi:hypothetical protein
MMAAYGGVPLPADQVRFADNADEALAYINHRYAADIVFQEGVCS